MNEAEMRESADEENVGPIATDGDEIGLGQPSMEPETLTKTTSSVDSDSDDLRTPDVEILPPVDGSMDALPPNVTVDRTQFSVGLGGLSMQRTRMSTESNQTEVTATISSPDTLAGAAAAVSAIEPLQANESTFESAQLFTRFLVGLAIYGVDEVMERLQKYDADIERNPDEYDLTDHLLARFDEAEDSIEAQVRYWAIGTLLWSQRSALNLTYRSFQTSVNVSQALLQGADKGTDNVLLRPIRRPVEKLVNSLTEGAKARIDEGRQVEVRDRALAQQTLDDIVGGVIDYISENPELADLISEQSLGLASSIMDTGRQVGAGADSAVEKLVRKIFRRAPRQEVQSSPLVGRPQTMYDPTAEAYHLERKSEQKPAEETD